MAQTAGPIRSLAGCTLTILLLAGPCLGCTWRSAGTEHHFGPVFYRQSSPPAGQAYVAQVLRLGIAAEGGDSWGLAVGMTERTVVAPVELDSRALAPGLPPGPIQPAASDGGEGWRFSPFYLRVQQQPGSFFVARTTLGAEAIAGDETNALTVGFAETTRFRPPDNAISRLHFEPARPLKAKASVWHGTKSTGPIPPQLTEALTR